MRRTLFALLALAALLAACGGDSAPNAGDLREDSGFTLEPPPEPSVDPAEVRRLETRKVQEVVMTDFAFSPKTLQAVANRSLSFTARNSGQQEHNFSIKGTESGDIDIDIPSGETKGIGFVPPATPGRYTFYCAFHRDQGMQGVLVVK